VEVGFELPPPPPPQLLKKITQLIDHTNLLLIKLHPVNVKLISFKHLLTSYMN
jgi:hypothetical protein